MNLGILRQQLSSLKISAYGEGMFKWVQGEQIEL